MDNQPTISKKKPLMMIFCLLVIIIVACVVMAIVVSTEKSDRPLSYIERGFGDDRTINSVEVIEVTVTTASNNESEATVKFLRNATPVKPYVKKAYIPYYVTDEVNYSASRFNLKIDDKYQYENIDYNTLKSILVYHHVKYGLDSVSDYSDAWGTTIRRFTMVGFFSYWDKQYPDNRPVRMTVEQLEKPVVVPTPEPTPTPTDYDRWYYEITFNQLPAEEQAFHRVYPANNYGWHGR